MSAGRPKNKRKLAFHIPKGYTHNPLKRYPDNKPCFCHSMKRFKRCCKKHVMALVTDEDAKNIIEHLANGWKIVIRPPTDEEIKAKKKELIAKAMEESRPGLVDQHGKPINESIS